VLSVIWGLFSPKSSFSIESWVDERIRETNTMFQVMRRQAHYGAFLLLSFLSLKSCQLEGKWDGWQRQ